MTTVVPKVGVLTVSADCEEDWGAPPALPHVTGIQQAKAAYTAILIPIRSLYLEFNKEASHKIRYRIRCPPGTRINT